MTQPGTRLHFLGTGNAFSLDGRLSCATILEHEGKRILIDAGPCVLVGLERQGISIESLDAILLTHLHGDHVAGMPFLMLKAMYGPAGQRARPFRVFGPQGCGERLRLLWDATYPDTKGWQAPDLTELTPERQTFELLGLRVEVVPMVHLEHSVGFRIFLGDISVAFSGDTDFRPCLLELCEGMDAAIVECTLLEDEPYPHVSLAELRAHRGDLGCRRLILNHLDDRVVSALAAEPIPDTVTTNDGDIIELP